MTNASNTSFFFACESSARDKGVARDLIQGTEGSGKGVARDNGVGSECEKGVARAYLFAS